MTTFWSCHLIVPDRRHVHGFIDADLSIEKILLLYFRNGLYPQTLTFFLAIMLILGGNVKYFYC